MRGCVHEGLGLAMNGSISGRSVSLAFLLAIVLAIAPRLAWAHEATGSLEITKVVDWAGMTPDPSATFEVCATGSVQVCEVFGADGGMVTITDLPADVYAISETDPGPGWTTSVSVNPVQVTAGATATTTVTNTRILRMPMAVQDCKAGGWEDLTRDDGTDFTNQGQCVRFVLTGR